MTQVDRTSRRIAWTALFRRLSFSTLVLIQTALGVWGMIWVLPYHGGSWIELAILLTFIPLYAFVAAGSWMAIFGFYYRRRGGQSRPSGDRVSPLARFRNQLPLAPMAPTAVLVPIYHEDVERVFRGLRASIESLQSTGQLEWFRFFILSDSRDPEVWLAERAAWLKLREDLGLEEQLFYRRRRVNLKAKTGNVADFLRRWGRRFEYFIVLDADSVMSGDAMVSLVRLMGLMPKAGLIQTVPRLFNARSAFARMQQFVTHLYGPLFNEGLAALQLNEAVFWGHNAIVRTEAFMTHCGLKSMRGIGLWRGHVLSHDFLEASYLRRAGYEVWLEPNLCGSYEESPPSLDDELIRDRRWSKGNLQHIRYMLIEPRLAFAHRLAFLNGIFAYLSSPVWFAFLVFSTLEVAKFATGQIDYFPDPNNPFPDWPQWHPTWAIWLVSSTLVTLFLPKFLALIDLLLFDRTRARQFGHPGRLIQGFLLENLFSILLAPIRMLAHTGYVLSAIANVSVHWAGQNRSSELTWGLAIRRHLPGMLLALGWSGTAFYLDPRFFYWTIPISLALILAAPITVMLSRFSLGQKWRAKGVWLTPPELASREPVLTSFMAAPSMIEQIGREAVMPSWLCWTLIHPQQMRQAVALAPQRNGCARAATQALADRMIEQGPGSVPSRQAARLLDDAEAIRRVHRHAWTAPLSDPWARLVEHFLSTLCTAPSEDEESRGGAESVGLQ